MLIRYACVSTADQDLQRTVVSLPQADRSDFMRAVALNFILGGNDAPAKNYSVFLLCDRLRFAPLYDVASMLADGLAIRCSRLAERYGSEEFVRRSPLRLES